MKTIRKNLGLALLTMLLFGLAYPAAMVGIAAIVAPQASKGHPIYRNDTLVGFAQVGQSFNSSEYFWSRPSAVDYDASGTGGSNLGPTNPDFLRLVQGRIDTLLTYHPGLSSNDIPADLVTASGSGLDPNISENAAKIQVNRVAEARSIPAERLIQLVDDNVEKPLLGIFGPGNYVNVLQLNLELDQLPLQK